MNTMLHFTRLPRKTPRRKIAGLGVLGIALLMGILDPAKAGNNTVPYRGRTDGWVTSIQFSPGKKMFPVNLTTVADEISVHGGHGYQISSITINSSKKSGLIATGKTDAVSADREHLFIDFTIASQNADLTAPIQYRGTFTIVGGTGRFEGATGSGELWGEARLTEGTWCGEFDGVISIPR
ncbi:MAG TPA: hypothetical protein PLW35_01300 [Verrucomicrobiota bacterium]|nr:hypothetical protein [Verrucomicrobiota bacterium]